MAESPQTKKSLHTKRSVTSKHPTLMHLHSLSQPLDSPAYDASEEDNDPLTDDAASTVSVATSASSLRPSAPPRPQIQNPGASRLLPSGGQGAAGIKTRHALVASILSSDEGVDSPTYDGDVESSTTAGPEDKIQKPTITGVSHHHYNSSASLASTLTSPITPSSHISLDPAVSTKLPALASSSASTTSPQSPSQTQQQQQRYPHLHSHSVPRPTPSHPSRPTEPPPANISTAAFNPAKLSPLDIQEYVRELIQGEGIAVGKGEQKKVYKINPPPTWRPVRIYADGECHFVVMSSFNSSSLFGSTP